LIDAQLVRRLVANLHGAPLAEERKRYLSHILFAVNVHCIFARHKEPVLKSNDRLNHAIIRCVDKDRLILPRVFTNDHLSLIRTDQDVTSTLRPGVACEVG
jgi:hypothetical protein